MNSPSGQSADAAADGPRRTREQLLTAAAELIAERGWDRVTTRAVADRAALPHGTISYHFPGKHDLLTEAALRTIERIAPREDLATLDSLPELITTITTWAGQHTAPDPVTQGVLQESLRACERNPALRERLATLLADYRRMLTTLLRTEQQRGTVLAGLDPAALATLIVAAGDGLLLHTLVDGELDTAAALEALGSALNTRAHPS